MKSPSTAPTTPSRAPGLSRQAAWLLVLAMLGCLAARPRPGTGERRACPPPVVPDAVCYRWYEADSLAAAGQDRAALAAFRWVAAHDSLFARDRVLQYRLAGLWHRIDSTGRAYEAMRRALDLGLLCASDCDSFRAFLLFDAARNSVLRQQLEANARQYATDPALLALVDSLAYYDQLARTGRAASVLNRAYPARSLPFEAVDSLNRPFLLRIVAAGGWPGIARLGLEGDKLFWLLVQHADSDPAFQERCLRLLQEALYRNNSSRRHYAYLCDRVLMKACDSQLFGTQFRTVDGPAGRLLEPFPIVRPDSLRFRRQAFGLPPFPSNLDSFSRMYFGNQ